MKKFSIYLLLFVCCSNAIIAQTNEVAATLRVFPYQQPTAVTEAVQQMHQWDKNQWKQFYTMLDDDSLKLQPTYALAAYTDFFANNVKEKKSTATHLLNGLSQVNTYYAQQIIIKYLGQLGDDMAVKPLVKYLSNEQHAANASLALASIKSPAAKAALSKAAVSSKEPMKQQILSALENMEKPLPQTSTSEVKPIAYSNPVQHLLALQNRMDAAKNPVQKRNILWEASKLKGIAPFMFVSKSLIDPEVKYEAANIVARQALADNSISGKSVRAVLETAGPLIRGVDSSILVKKLSAHLTAMPFDNGYLNLFNGKDLSGWKALVGNPISRSKMTAEELAAAQKLANEKTKNDWIVKDGLLIFTGHGDNLATDEMYGDMEMFVDWKITEKGDAGIYLRGTPQVQIWDTSRREVGAQVGSGGLYNNQTNPSKPLVVADNAIGEWNTFHIIMKGEKVTVYLNGILVTDNVTLENYWDRKQPIFPKEQIELQAHGTYVAYRNIYLKKMDKPIAYQLSQEEQQAGYTLLFDGTNMDQWVGNKAGYLLEEGAIVVHPELSAGNLYTKNEYADFTYRFEFQLTPGSNNGIGIRTPKEGDAAYVGMEIQVLDNEADKYKNLQPYQYHGSVYGVIPAKRGFLKPIGEWNKEEIDIKGNKIKVTLNGEVIVEGDIAEASKNGTMDHKEHPGLKNTSGHIGFLGHGDVVRFRNIRIKKW